MITTPTPSVEQGYFQLADRVECSGTDSHQRESLLSARLPAPKEVRHDLIPTVRLNGRWVLAPTAGSGSAQPPFPFRGRLGRH
jgi:hypothetical protein